MNILNEHYAQVSKFFKKEGLTSLSDDEHKYRGLNTMDLLNVNFDNSQFPKFNKFKILSDIKNCNNDLKLFTAHLFLYRPYINDPLTEFKIFQGQKIFTYHQNGSDWLYSSYVSCCYEKLYNFWDRIGDTLAYYFELNIPEFKVGFPQSVDKMKSLDLMKGVADFEFLQKFRDNEFKEFNKHRKDIVHYYQFETTYKEKFYENNDDEDMISELWNWKRNMPEYFKEHLEKTCDGYYHTLNLIKNLT